VHYRSRLNHRRSTTGGKGTGQPCAVCEQAITEQQLEYELDIGGRTLRFHDKCLDMWRQARA
jgi:hypothetical protein